MNQLNDHEVSVNPQRPIAVVYGEVSRVALLGLGINLLLGMVKLVGGLIGDSFALISDSVNSLGDVFSSVVVLFALQVSATALPTSDFCIFVEF